MKIKLLQKSRFNLYIQRSQSVIILILMLGFGIAQEALAQCSIAPIGGTTKASTLSCTTLKALSGCGGIYVLGDDIKTKSTILMDKELDLKCLGVITLIVKDSAAFDFSPGNNKLLLTEGSTLIFRPGSGLIGGSCNASERIYIGSNLLASCNGEAGADFSFDQLLAFGGSGSLSSNSPVCVGYPITLSANPPPTATGSFTYSFKGPGLPETEYSTNSTYSFIATAATVGLYSVRMKNSNIATPMIAEISVAVKASPTKPVITASGPLTFCEGGNVSLSSSSAPSYIWSNGATTQSIQSSSNGSFSVQVGHTLNSCLSLPSNEVVVSAVPYETPDVKFSASAVSPICEGTPVTYTVTASGVGSSPSYQWKLNGADLLNSGASYSSSILKNGDKVSCQVISSALCSTANPSNMEIAMQVNPNVTPSLGLTVSQAGTICLNSTMTYSTMAVNAGSSPSYQWKVNDMDIGVYSPSFTTAAMKNGDRVQCLLTSSETCVTARTASSEEILMSVITVPEKPTLPSNQDLVCAPVTGFVADWTDSPTATRYYLDVATDAGFSQILPAFNNLDVGSISQKDVRGLLSSSSYYARVRANNFCGTSGNSNSTTVLLPSTIFNGTNWSNGAPDNSKRAVFAANATITSKVNACSCVINSGVVVNVGLPDLIDANANTQAILMVEDEVVVEGSLVFENNASLIQVNDNPLIINKGKIVYKRTTAKMHDFDYTYWCSPVKDQLLGSLSPLTLPDKYLSYGTAWVIEGPNAYMNPAGKGFIIRVPRMNLWPAGTGSLYAFKGVFVGVPNNGVINRATMGINRDNLIGNPYPSALDANEFILANAGMISNPLEIWTHNTPMNAAEQYNSNDYAYYSLAGGIKAISGGPRPNGRVAAGQGFFLVSDKVGHFVFNNKMRSSARIMDTISNNQFFRLASTKKAVVPQKSRLWLNLTNKAGAFKQILLGYMAGATNDYDKLFDANCPARESQIEFYSVNSERKLMIQARALPFDESDQVPLGYKTVLSGEFSIAIDSTDGLLTNRDVYLQDKLKGSFSNLNKGAFTFSSAAGEFNDRFVLWYKPSQKEEITAATTAMDGIHVLVKNKQIKINSTVDMIDKVRLYDLKGSMLHEKGEINSNEFVLTQFHSREQFLIVQLLLKNGRSVTKEIVF